MSIDQTGNDTIAPTLRRRYLHVAIVIVVVPMPVSAPCHVAQEISLPRRQLEMDMATIRSDHGSRPSIGMTRALS